MVIHSVGTTNKNEVPFVVFRRDKTVYIPAVDANTSYREYGILFLDKVPDVELETEVDDNAVRWTDELMPNTVNLYRLKEA